jgi:hypothetical protein
MTPFDLAPAAVVRVAAWPVEALEQFAAPHLAEKARSADVGDEAALTAYEEAYRHILESQRRQLWRVTAGDARFCCALALSSPSLASRLQDGIPPAQRNKRTRHLEKSLYRYLARTVARIEPHGLWTGVTLAEFGSEEATMISPRAPHTYFAPELHPFRLLLRTLGQREPYRTRGPYRLNPTLQMLDTHRWCYARRKTDGTLCWRDLPPSPTWQVLHSGLAALPPGPLPVLLQRLAESVPGKVAETMLEFAFEVGLLIGGLQFPCYFTSPWEALEQAEASLEIPERHAWSEARKSIQRTCKQLACYINKLLSEGDTPAAELGAATATGPVLRANTAVREAIAALARALFLPSPAQPQSVLRCDFAAPFRIQLGRDDRQLLIALLQEWAHLEHQYGTASRRHELQTRRVLRSCGAGHELMAVPMDHSTSNGVILGCIDSGLEPGPPLGALVLRPGRNGLAHSWVRGLSDVATATHARHAYYLGCIGDPLLPWFRATFQDLQRTCGLEIVDLVHDHPGSPNLLARPRYTDSIVDPWGTTPGALSCRDARLVQGPHPAAILLQAGQRHLAVHVFSALVVPPTDVVLERLMATSFNWRTPVPPLEDVTLEDAVADADLQCHRSRLSSGAVLEPRRFQLPDHEVEELIQTRGARRFLLWQRLARSYQWPALLRITFGSAPALLVPTDSPLAIEVAFEGVRALTTNAQGMVVRTPMIVEEVVEGPWLPGAHGSYMVELVLPVRRTHHLWQRPNGQLSSKERRHANESMHRRSALSI